MIKTNAQETMSSHLTLLNSERSFPNKDYAIAMHVQVHSQLQHL